MSHPTNLPHKITHEMGYETQGGKNERRHGIFAD